MAKSTPHPHGEETPEERRREMVRILAAGILRLHKKHALGKPRAEGLDVAPEIVLSGEESKRPSRAKKTSRLGASNT